MFWIFILKEIFALVGVLATIWLSVRLVRQIAAGLASPLFEFDDVLDWAEEISTSANQLQKAYDWEINQWSTFGNAILAATLAFISACTLEIMKQTLKSSHVAAIMIAGVVTSIALYVTCRVRIAKLRNEFLLLYTLVAHLH